LAKLGRSVSRSAVTSARRGPEEGFHYLILFLAISEIRRPRRARRIGLSLALAIYFWVGNQE